MRLFDIILFITFVIGFALLLVAGIMYVVNGLFREDIYFNTRSAHFAYVGLIIMICVAVAKLIEAAIELFKEIEKKE